MWRRAGAHLSALAACGAARLSPGVAGPGAVGAACRGVVVAVATARLLFACRDRRSAVRRTVPSLRAGIGSTMT
jgi:hypothetical protein